MEQSKGGFGCYLMMAHEWAEPEADAKQHYELFADYVAPQFQGSLDRIVGSKAKARGDREHLYGRMGKALEEATTRHQAETAADASR